jgi:thioredoxin 1
MTIEITDSNFENFIAQSNLPVVIDFWAEWCPPCKDMANSMEDISDKYNGKAMVGKVDVDYHPNVSTKYGVRNLPTVLFLINGKVIDKSVGFATPAQLESKLNKMLERQLHFGISDF